MPPETAARPAASSPPAPAAAADSTAPSRLFDFWPRFLLFPALAVLLYPPFVLGWGGDSFPVRAAWVALLTFCWFCVSGAYHEAAHQTLFRRPFWNLWFGRGLGVLVLVPYTAFRETHRWHHAYLNTPDDYELWPYCDPGCSLAFRRMFVWLEILGGVLVAPYIYCRIYFVGEPRLKPDARRTILREMVATGVIWGLVLTGLVAAANARGFDWRQFDPVWLLPLLLSPMLNALRKLIEHLGMTSRDPFLGTRTIVSGNWLSRIACFFNFDIAVHGPHHRYPKAQHYELGARLSTHLATRPEVPLPIYSSYLAAARDMLPNLWRNPATGDHSQGTTPQEESGPSGFEPVATLSTQ